MSHTILDDDGPVVVGAYAGPANEPGPRLRVQLTIRGTGGDDFVALTTDQAITLAAALHVAAVRNQDDRASFEVQLVVGRFARESATDQ